jgi:GT2 family glycosyltransferase
LPHTVYVVDNASSDETVAAVAAAFPAVRLLVNEENLGFAAGNNIGLHAAFAEGAEAVLVLNNDTTLEPDALAELDETAQQHPEAGILSPLILFAKTPHTIWFAGATVSAYTGQDRHLHYDAAYEEGAFAIADTDRAAGCAMYITRACYERIGGFDPALFMFFEDVEYSLRAREAGFRVLLVPKAVVYHHVSVSTGGSKSPNGIYYMLRNGITVVEQHYPLARPLTIVRRVVMFLAMTGFILVKPRAIARITDVLAGFRDAYRHRLGRRPTANGSPRRHR